MLDNETRSAWMEKAAVNWLADLRQRLQGSGPIEYGIAGRKSRSSFAALEWHSGIVILRHVAGACASIGIAFWQCRKHACA